MTDGASISYQPSAISYLPLAKCLDPLNLTWIMLAEGSSEL